MLVAVLWAFLYGVLQYFYPGAYAVGGTVKALNMGDLFQLHCALDCGFRRHYSHVDPVALPDNPGDGDGLMYVAILIARLTGVYPVVEAKA